MMHGLDYGKSSESMTVIKSSLKPSVRKRYFRFRHVREKMQSFENTRWRLSKEISTITGMETMTLMDFYLFRWRKLKLPCVTGMS